MLERNDREKVENYIDSLISSISSAIQDNIKSGMSSKEIIDSSIRLTVNKVTPESKMILSSVYNMLMEKTLQLPIFQDPENRAAFHSKDILKVLTSNLSFDVPSTIDYEETNRLINKWTASGAIVIVGGVVSISTKSIVPVGIAVIIAGIMLVLLKNSKTTSSEDVEHVVQDYLKDVKSSLLSWVDGIETTYDDEIGRLVKELR